MRARVPCSVQFTSSLFNLVASERKAKKTITKPHPMLYERHAFLRTSLRNSCLSPRAICIITQLSSRCASHCFQRLQGNDASARQRQHSTAAHIHSVRMRWGHIRMECAARRPFRTTWALSLFSRPLKDRKEKLAGSGDAIPSVLHTA